MEEQRNNPQMGTHIQHTEGDYRLTHEIFTHVIFGQSLSLLQVHYYGGSGYYLKLRPAKDRPGRCNINGKEGKHQLSVGGCRTHGFLRHFAPLDMLSS